MSETRTVDYLVVGAGATGMAFVDTLVTATDATVLMVDRRDGPGGHWRDAYPFVRLHQPSACYGVASMPLGVGGPDLESPDEAFGERATGEEIVAYYDTVLDKLRGTGRVEFLGGTDYLGGRLIRVASGEEQEVEATKVVDATRLQAEVPATSPPRFEVADGVRLVPAGEVDTEPQPPDGYVIIGAGKTAQDTVIHLLDRGVDPGAITWIRPRDPWLTPRRFFQPGSGLPTTIDGWSRSVEIAATARSRDEFFERSEAEGLLVRIDPGVEPEVYRGATISDNELAKLRSVEDVVRLGYVQRITRSEIVLDEGTVPTSPARLHVHCTAKGLLGTPGIAPIFQDDEIVLQQVRFGMAPYCAALLARVEATELDDDGKNHLCRPMPYPDRAEDWLAMMLGSMGTDYRVVQNPELAQWADGCRLNLSAGLAGMGNDPIMQEALVRYATNASAAVANLGRLLGRA